MIGALIAKSKVTSSYDLLNRRDLIYHLLFRGSLTSYPGLKMATAAAMSGSWNRKSLHTFHLLFVF